MNNNFFYSVKIEFPNTSQTGEDPQEFLQRVYHQLDINTQMKKEKVYHPKDIHNTYIHKSYYYRKESDVISFSLPPQGPINEYTYCPFCEQQGPQYHTEECQGPWDQELLTEEGIEFYSDKIKHYFPDVEDPHEYNFFYKQIFPKRGIQKIQSDKWTISKFPNCIQLKFQTPTHIDYPDGVTIIAKITQKDNNTYLYINRIPNVIIEPKDLIKTFVTDKIPLDSENVTYTIINCNTSEKITKDDQILKLEDITEHLRQFDQNVSYSSYYNIIKLQYDEHTKINIKIGGSVQVWFSEETENPRKTLNDIIDNIKTQIDTPKYKEKVTPKTSLYFENKVLNTIVPYTTENGKMTYNSTVKKGSFPPQPASCQNRIPKFNVLKKADIKRPVPFSFSKGKTPTRGLRIIDEGKPTTAKKLLGDNKILYEPCCEAIKGNSPTNTKFFPVLEVPHHIITQEELKKITKSKLREDDIRQQLKDWLKESTSTKETMIRRLFYGFPNNFHPDDKADLYDIKTGIEKIPKEPIKATKPISFKRKRQQDIHSAVYVPGTQLDEFGGNGKLIRDSRSYHGLLKLFEIPEDRAKSILMEIITNYFSHFTIGDNDIKPIDSELISKIKEYTIYNTLLDTKKTINKKLKKEKLQNIKEHEKIEATVDNQTYQWYQGIQGDYIRKAFVILRISKVNENLVSVIQPNGKIIESDNIFFPYKKKSYCIFIPTQTMKQLEEDKLHKFAFNYYIHSTGETKLVPNQPFIFIEKLEKDNPSLDQTEILHYALDNLLE